MDALGKLRELLSKKPDNLLFHRVLSHMIGWDDQDTFEVGLSYANEHMEQWPWDIKRQVTPEVWPTYPEGEPHPSLLLCHSLSLVWGCISKDQGAMTLSRTPYAINLKELYLGADLMTDEGAQAIANSPCLMNLESLDLEYNRVGDAGVISIMESPFLAKLTHLNLSMNLHGMDGINAIANSPKSASLESLGAWTNNVAPHVVSRAFINSPYLSELIRSKHRGLLLLQAPLEHLNISYII